MGFGSVTTADKGEGPWGVSPVGARNATRNGVWQGGPSEVDGPDAALIILEEVLYTHKLGKCPPQSCHPALSRKDLLEPWVINTCHLLSLPPFTYQSLARKAAPGACMGTVSLSPLTPPPAHCPVLVSQLEQL